MYPIFSTVNLQTRLRRTKNFFLMGLRMGAAMVCLLVLPALLAGVAGRVGRAHGGRGRGRWRGVWRVGSLGAGPAGLRVARDLLAVLDLFVDADGEEPEDALREAHFTLYLGDARGGRPEKEVVVRGFGPLLDDVGEAAAAHRLVLLYGRAVVDEELAELFDDGLGSRLVLLGDDEQDHVVLALRIRGGHEGLLLLDRAGVRRSRGAAVDLWSGAEPRLWFSSPRRIPRANG